ncbi:MAG: glycosyltransferase family 9 protein [bacterium]|nr:glycosyltransferase family 9 protein [bacterium]
MTDVLIDYQGGWGIGDLLCSDPLVAALVERHGPDTRVYLNGKVGNVIHNPLVAGMARVDQSFDEVVEVRLFTHMPHEDYGRLEAMPSLIDHMLSYGGFAPDDPRPRDRRPQLHLAPDDLAAQRRLPPKRRPRIAVCSDFVDPLRHWPVERWHDIAQALLDAGAEVVLVGQHEHLSISEHESYHDLVGELTIRETAAVLATCDLFVGNNSGPFHYAQAAGVPCVVLFSLAQPERFVHPGAQVFPVEATGLPCLHCMTRCFAAMQVTGCTAAPRGRCMTDIPTERVLETIDHALRHSRATPPRHSLPHEVHDRSRLLVAAMHNAPAGAGQPQAPPQHRTE